MIEELSSVCSILSCWRWDGLQSDVTCIYICLCIFFYKKCHNYFNQFL